MIDLSHITAAEVEHFIAALGSIAACLVSLLNRKKIINIRLAINSRLSQLLEVTRKEAFSSGQKNQCVLMRGGEDMKWAGVVGRGIPPELFESYCSGVVMGGWKPHFIVLHNTANPTLSHWHDVSGEARMQNLETYYRDAQKWHAGPHLFIADDLIWVFTPLNVAGVHSPAWNSISWGVELVGNYDIEELSDAVRHNAVVAITALSKLAGLMPQSMKLHCEDPLTTHHNCPGKNIHKDWIIDQVLAAMSPEVIPVDPSGEEAS